MDCKDPDPRLTPLAAPVGDAATVPEQPEVSETRPAFEQSHLEGVVSTQVDELLTLQAGPNQGRDEGPSHISETGKRPGTPYPDDLLLLSPRPRTASLERQLTNGKWDAALEYLMEHPEIAEVVAGQAPGHIYRVIRADDGTYQRVHERTDRVLQ
jgi:hypothetical protein